MPQGYLDSSIQGGALNPRGLPTRTRRTAFGAALAAVLGVLVLSGAIASVASATPLWLTPYNVSDPGQDGFEPEVVEDQSGNMMFVWTRSDGANLRIQSKFRAADGTWDATQTISDPSGDASEPQVAFDPSGNAIAVWNRFDGSKTRVQAAFRPSGGGFGTPQTLSGAGQNASNPQVSMDNSGNAVAVWERLDGVKLRIEAAVRPASGSFGATQILSDAGQDAFEPKVKAGPAVDNNAVAVWTRSDGAHLRVQSARRRDVIGYPRPKGGSPIHAALVPAYQACTSPNRTHGAPLAFGSCAPPVTSSSVLTIGTPDVNGFAANSVNSVTYKVLTGDARVDLSMTDIRNKPSGTDYTGRVLARVPVQITDRNNAAEIPETGTVQSTLLQFPADCVTTASTSVGSTCSLSTTVNAQIPGAIVDGQRSIWEFGQVEIRDAGPNGTGYAACPPTCGDGDESTFMREGIFVP
jgi:hypothetical protein